MEGEKRERDVVDGGRGGGGDIYIITGGGGRKADSRDRGYIEREGGESLGIARYGGGGDIGRGRGGGRGVPVGTEVHRIPDS